MKLFKLLTMLLLIAEFCVANQTYNDTLDKAYSSVAFTYSSMSGDVEGDGIALSGNFLLGNQDLVTQVQFGYMTADEVLGTDVSAFDIEAYTLALGLGYIFELNDNVHLVPNLGYQYTEYGILGYEAATMNSFVYGAMVRYLLLENTVLSAGVNFMTGEFDSALSELDGLEADATAYTVSATHHFSDTFSAGIAYGTDNMDAQVMGINLSYNF